jgi:hypothetical protein
MAPTDEELRSILTKASTIAVVGVSEKPERDSNEVARYLRSQGYSIVPVNPALPQVLGLRSYPSLTAIPAEVRVDLAVIFRRGEAVPPVVDQAIARGIPAVWMQLGVQNPEAAKRARAHGLAVVEDTCSMAAHRRLKLPPAAPRP